MKPIILILEKHHKTRTSVSKWLTRVLPDYFFLVARNCKDVLAIVHSEPPDIVLIGIDLLLRDGLKDIIEIKSAASSAQIVVVASHDDEVYQTECPVEVSAYILREGLVSFLRRMLPAMAGSPILSA